MTVDEERLQEALLGRLRLLGHDEPELGADTRAAQRARLVAMAAVRPTLTAAAAADAAADAAGDAVRSPAVDRPWWRTLAGRAVDTPVPRWRTRLTAGLAGAAMTVGALSGLLALAQDAEPGDLLYGLKRGTEQTQLALASDADRGLTLLGFASTRLAELAELTGEDAGALPAAVGSPDGAGTAPAVAGPDAATVVDVLTTMDDQTTEGTSSLTMTVVDDGDPEALQTLADWAAGQRDGLLALPVPAGAEEARARAVLLVDEVAARAASWQAALGCPDGFVTSEVDRLGPVAGGCAAPGGTAPVPSSAAAPSTGTTGDPTGDPTPSATGGADPGAPGSAPAGTAQAPTAGTGSRPTVSAAPTTTPAPAVPSVVAPVPAPGAATGSSPAVQVPLPLPSASVCLGGLICVGD